MLRTHVLWYSTERSLWYMYGTMVHTVVPRFLHGTMVQSVVVTGPLYILKHLPKNCKKRWAQMLKPFKKSGAKMLNGGGCLMARSYCTSLGNNLIPWVRSTTVPRWDGRRRVALPSATHTQHVIVKYRF